MNLRFLLLACLFVVMIGAALGVYNAANSLGQASGPLLGGALFIWRPNAPYLFTGALLVAVALVIGWRGRRQVHR